MTRFQLPSSPGRVLLQKLQKKGTIQLCENSINKKKKKGEIIHFIYLCLLQFLLLKFTAAASYLKCCPLPFTYCTT